MLWRLAHARGYIGGQSLESCHGPAHPRRFGKSRPGLGTRYSRHRPETGNGNCDGWQPAPPSSTLLICVGQARGRVAAVACRFGGPPPTFISTPAPNESPRLSLHLAAYLQPRLAAPPSALSSRRAGIHYVSTTATRGCCMVQRAWKGVHVRSASRCRHPLPMRQ